MTSVQCAVVECAHNDYDGHPKYGICRLETSFISAMGICTNMVLPPKEKK
jgi:hypothetical protein